MNAVELMASTSVCLIRVGSDGAGTWSSEVVGIFVIIIEDFGSNLWLLLKGKLRPKIYGYYSRYKVTCGAVEESSHLVLHRAAALKYF